MRTDPEIRDQLTPVQVLGLTAFAEARGDALQGHSSVEERLAVMAVVRNRTRDVKHRWPDTYPGVCFQRLQFSCWNPGADANHQLLLAQADILLSGQAIDPLLRESLWLATGVISGEMLDQTQGSTCYFAPGAMVPATSVPAWAKDGDGHPLPPTVGIGRQLFFRI